MPYGFHKDPCAYFRIQNRNTHDSVLPFLISAHQLTPGQRVLEIGCDTGGMADAVLQHGAQVIGIDINERSLVMARQYIDPHLQERLTLLLQDATLPWKPAWENYFDVIILKDVIEHIENKRALIDNIAKALKPTGICFVGFPPWHMPFGGHQQICAHWLPARMPYIHLLPTPLYTKLLRVCGESKEKAAYLLALRQTGISIEKFQRLVQQHGLYIQRRKLYLLNPIYTLKFRVPSAALPWPLMHIPLLRNFYTTSAYYLLTKGLPQKSSALAPCEASAENVASTKC